MKKLQPLVLALSLVALGSVAWAATNLKSSRSNVYRLVYSDDVMSKAQAKRILAKMDKIDPANEASVKEWLAQNLKRHGVQTDHIKEILFLPAAKTRRLITIALLTNSPDEAAALKVTCPDCVLVRHPPSKPNP